MARREARRSQRSLAAGSEVHNEVSPEQRLFLSIIQIALLDALSKSAITHPHQRAAARVEVIRWFLDGDRHFEMVCELAGLDATRTRDEALAYLKRNMTGSLLC